mmetsp:Transcript_661/g.2029  ORF Transcript_661/g.2029 Transcript_661/m.2029 type:complete len:224 (-) Transcript_661:67-738(-)
MGISPEVKPRTKLGWSSGETLVNLTDIFAEMVAQTQLVKVHRGHLTATLSHCFQGLRRNVTHLNVEFCFQPTFALTEQFDTGLLFLDQTALIEITHRNAFRSVQATPVNKVLELTEVHHLIVGSLEHLVSELSVLAQPTVERCLATLKAWHHVTATLRALVTTTTGLAFAASSATTDSASSLTSTWKRSQCVQGTGGTHKLCGWTCCQHGSGKFSANASTHSD